MNSIVHRVLRLLSATMSTLTSHLQNLASAFGMRGNVKLLTAKLKDGAPLVSQA